jgi:hypothetical protein
MKRLLIAFASILAGCAPVAEMIQNAGQPTAKTVSATEQSIDQAQLDAAPGGYSRRSLSPHPVLPRVGTRCSAAVSPLEQFAKLRKLSSIARTQTGLGK